MSAPLGWPSSATDSLHGLGQVLHVPNTQQSDTGAAGLYQEQMHMVLLYIGFTD